jgi:catechol-2,3-dioxygenase
MLAAGLPQITIPAKRSYPAENEMADPRVTGLRSIEYSLPDVETSAKFYEKLWGLDPVEVRDGAHYFRATGAEHHIVVLHEGPDATVKQVNFAADSKADVDSLHAKLGGLGVSLAGDPAPLASPGGGYGFSFTDRDGLSYAVSSDVAEHPDTTMAADRPFKLSHVVLNSEKVDDQTDWFCDALGFRLSDKTARMNFIRCSMDHHSIAFAKMGGPSLNHTAFEVPDFDALMRGAGRLKQKGFEVDWGVGRHGPGNNIFTYFREPNGLVVEYTAEVDQVDDSYEVGGPDDWAQRVSGPDRWGFAPPPNEKIREAMHGNPQPPGVPVE